MGRRSSIARKAYCPSAEQKQKAERLLFLARAQTSCAHFFYSMKLERSDRPYLQAEGKKIQKMHLRACLMRGNLIQALDERHLERQQSEAELKKKVRTNASFSASFISDLIFPTPQFDLNKSGAPLGAPLL